MLWWCLRRSGEIDLKMGAMTDRDFGMGMGMGGCEADLEVGLVF